MTKQFAGDDNSMSSNPFETAAILDGIRRWVEIESPTERPDQVNRLADLVAATCRPPSTALRDATAAAIISSRARPGGRTPRASWC
jgi:glutamate carboxypeptidase